MGTMENLRLYQPEIFYGRLKIFFGFTNKLTLSKVKHWEQIDCARSIQFFISVKRVSNAIATTTALVLIDRSI